MITSDTEVGVRAFGALHGYFQLNLKLCVIFLFCSDCEHVRLLWPKHRQLFDVRRKCKVSWLLQDKVLKEEASHLPDAGHG